MSSIKKDLKSSKLTLVTQQNSDLFETNHPGSQRTAEDSMDYYIKNQFTIKAVDQNVPVPMKCPQCEYDGFTQIEFHHTARSVCLSLPLCGFFCLCKLIGCCEKTRDHCLDDWKEADHKCFNCKQIIAQRKKDQISKELTPMSNKKSITLQQNDNLFDEDEEYKYESD